MEKDEEFMPKIITFLCNWCAYAGADLAGVSRLQYPPSILPIRLMCSSRVNPLFILTGYLQGADGVIVAGCHLGDCHYQEGNYYTRRKLAMLKNIFENAGLDSERILLRWISASEAQRYVEVVSDFTEKIIKLGENSSNNRIFL